MSCYYKYNQEAEIYIPKFNETSSIVFYKIHVKIHDVEWTLERRYKDFDQLNDKLVEENSISKKLIPPKKLIGNKNPEFVEKRRQELEKYLQDLLALFRITMPRVLAEFLDFNKYDIIYLLQDLAKFFNESGDSLLSVTKEYSFSALELFAISERLCMPCPDNDETSKYDFSHVLDFCSQLEILKGTPIKDTGDIGCDYNSIDVPIGRSNIIPKNLFFNLNAFRNLKTIQFFSLSTENIVDIAFLKPSLQYISVHNTTITRINQVLMCDNLHKIDLEDTPNKNKSPKDTWCSVKELNFSGNLLTTIDSSIKTVPNICTLNLDQNRLSHIQNLNELPLLQTLSLAANLITNCIDWHLELGNLVTLNLAQNKLKTLTGLKKLYSLENLDLSCNHISDLDEVDNVACLPVLVALRLTGNPLAGSVDYRPRVLARFHGRASEICLDSEKGSHKELDTALVHSALLQSKIGRQLPQ
ncbi:nischarin [Eupeodes corollae]|uniref:nischarin n=1 Tax=Eupeodes corollae TaxID=290404 RepID=UPI0024937F6D|nr:nischarin [Eupeodes corollae]